jgi:hypothetical protein
MRMPSPCTALFVSSHHTQLYLVIPQNLCGVRAIPPWSVTTNFSHAAPTLFYQTAWCQTNSLSGDQGWTSSMEPWTRKKRLWDDDDSMDLQLKRRGSTIAASSPRQPSPLPLRAGDHAYSHFLDQRRLPPLYAPPCSTSAEPIGASYSQFSPASHDTALPGSSRPRSQSLFNFFQHPRWQASQSTITGMKSTLLCYDTGTSTGSLSTEYR